MNISGLTLALLFITCFATLFLYFIKWKLSRQHLYKLAAKIPLVDCVPIMPFVGHALYFLGETEQILQRLRQFTKNISPPKTIWLAHRLFFCINRPEDMEVILNSPKCLSKDDLYRLTVYFAGNGIFSLPVREWKRHRKVIMPTFNKKILDTFVEVFSNQAEICVQQLESQTGKLIDMLTYTGRYALDTVCETAMGISINAQTTDSNIDHAINHIRNKFRVIEMHNQSNFYKKIHCYNVEGCMDCIMIRMFNVSYHFDWIYNLTSVSRKERKYATIFHKFILEVIEKKVADYRKNVADQNNVIISEDDKKRVAFLELLIELSENGENWTIEELRSEVSTFMVAGSDTTATVASFTLLVLAMHPEIQEKCYEEVMEVLGPDRQLEYTDLPKFVYLEKVVKESMRLFPVGPVIVRKVDEDIEVGGYVLPKGAGLVLSIIGIHYSEVYYKDPWKFDPERFSPEEIAKRHKYSYLPFSGGPRNCIGTQYGMMSVKTLLAVMLRKYRAETIYKDISEIRLQQSIVIKAVEGFPLRLYSRN